MGAEEPGLAGGFIKIKTSGILKVVTLIKPYTLVSKLELKLKY